MRHPKANDDARHRFQQKIERYEAEGRTIVYIDESGFAHGSTRTQGYAALGERCHGVFDWQMRGRTNVIGALVGTALLTTKLFQTNINADIFCAWVTQDLIPKLPPDCVIVMDNAAFHKRQDIQNAILDANHTLEYLPRYSPDLNPIEHKWAFLKQIRQKLSCPVQKLFPIESIYLT